LLKVDDSLQISETGEPDQDGFREFTLTTKRDEDLGETLMRELTNAGFRLRALSRAQPTLEDVFLAATRRSWDVKSEDLKKS
jgi:ABC-2 type transport system ATP-binding protein